MKFVKVLSVLIYDINCKSDQKLFWKNIKSNRMVQLLNYKSPEPSKNHYRFRFKWNSCEYYFNSDL